MSANYINSQIQPSYISALQKRSGAVKAASASNVVRWASLVKWIA